MYILIVDDSKSICGTLEKLISEELGYKTIIANDKHECEERLLEYKGKIAVAILDLALPDAPDGEVIDSVTKFNIPSIVLTGSEVREDILKDKDIVDYVIKEGRFSYEYLLSLIKRNITTKNTKVIVANDSKEVALHAIKLLKRYRLSCFYAKDGQEVLDILKKVKDVKLVFTDYSMPNMNGLELTKKIRQSYSKDTLSIITLTSTTEGNSLAKFLKFGANDFLYNTFSEEEFFAKLNSNLETLELFEEIKNKANKDYMTGMFNRRYFFDEGEVLYQKAIKDNQELFVAMFDIDKFKNINDTYGHDIGDIAIQEVAIIVNQFFDSDAIISRFGGEEFCVIQSNIDEVKFVASLEEIRKKFETNIINTEKGDIQYTVSVGYTSNKGQILDDMVNTADEGLYLAKNNGRNQVRTIK